jgi:hypothetical protein
MSPDPLSRFISLLAIKRSGVTEEVPRSEPSLESLPSPMNHAGASSEAHAAAKLRPRPAVEYLSGA